MKKRQIPLTNQLTSKRQPIIKKKEHAQLEAFASELGVLSSMRYSFDYADPSIDYNDPFDDSIWDRQLIDPMDCARLFDHLPMMVGVFPAVATWPQEKQESFIRQFRLVQPQTLFVNCEAKDELIQYLLRPMNFRYHSLKDRVFSYYEQLRYETVLSMQILVELSDPYGYLHKYRDVKLTKVGINTLVEAELLHPSLVDLSINMMDVSWQYLRLREKAENFVDGIVATKTEEKKPKRLKRSKAKNVDNLHQIIERLSSTEAMLTDLFSPTQKWIYPSKININLATDVQSLDHDVLVARFIEVDKLLQEFTAVNARRYRESVIPLLVESYEIECKLKYLCAKQLEYEGLVVLEHFDVPKAGAKDCVLVIPSNRGLLWLKEKQILTGELFDLFKPLLEARSMVIASVNAILAKIAEQYYHINSIVELERTANQPTKSVDVQ